MGIVKVMSVKYHRMLFHMHSQESTNARDEGNFQDSLLTLIWTVNGNCLQQMSVSGSHSISCFDFEAKFTYVPIIIN